MQDFTSAIQAIKIILETLNIGELRLVEDYAQCLRIDLQDKQLKALKTLA